MAAGTATSYSAAGELTADGEWTFEPDATADYRTRVVVRRPADADDASGTVLVEWLNVSGGVDADPEFVTLREEIVRQGHTWVGVSAQVIGVEGGPVAVRVDVPGAEAAGKGLKALDPERYGSLEHPGDAFSYDIYSQVARAVREGAALGDLEPSQVVAVGESQSAFALVTYVNGVQPLTKAFDGFFVHSRGAAGLGAVRGRASRPTSRARSAARGRSSAPTPTSRSSTCRPRTTWSASSAPRPCANPTPTGSGSGRCRAPRTPTSTWWARRPRSSSTAACRSTTVRSTSSPRRRCATSSAGSRVVNRRRRRLALEVTEGDAPEMRRDADGIALGGVRTPPVDVPVRVLSGVKGPSDSVICLLLGSTTPLPAERLAELYRLAGRSSSSATTPPSTRRSRPASCSRRTARRSSSSPTPSSSPGSGPPATYRRPPT